MHEFRLWDSGPSGDAAPWPYGGLGFILGIIALVTGKQTLSEIDANPGLYTNRGTVLGGVICGLISCIWSALGILSIIAVITIGVAAAAGS